MKAARYLSIVDLIVLIVVAVALFLPPRDFQALATAKTDAVGREQLAFAEARTWLPPGGDRANAGDAVYDYARRLGQARQTDWAVQAAAVAAEGARTQPSYWRALLAVSVAHVDRLEANEALDYATRALAACNQSGDGCPSWEQLRVELYQRHLDAGVRSGIDPRKNPAGFRDAGAAALRQVRILGSGIAPQPQPSGSATPPTP